MGILVCRGVVEVVRYSVVIRMVCIGNIWDGRCVSLLVFLLLVWLGVVLLYYVVFVLFGIDLCLLFCFN